MFFVSLSGCCRADPWTGLEVRDFGNAGIILPAVDNFIAFRFAMTFRQNVPAAHVSVAVLLARLRPIQDTYFSSEAHTQL